MGSVPLPQDERCPFVLIAGMGKAYHASLFIPGSAMPLVGPAEGPLSNLYLCFMETPGMTGSLGIAQHAAGSAVSAPPVHLGGESKPGDGY